MMAVGAAVCGLGLGVAWLRRRAKRTVSSLPDLASFTLEEVLHEGDLTVLLGRFAWQPAGERALIKLAVKPVPLSAGLVQSMETRLSSYSGAEYAYYTGRAALLSLIGAPALRPAYSLEVIAPASEKQIDRSRPQPGVLISESAELYRDVVGPYIHGMDPKSVAWIGHVLDLSKEKERVLFNDKSWEDGFLLNVDTKWKSHPDCHVSLDARKAWKGHAAVRDLYCLAICHRTDLRSLRDLTAEHLPLLRRILSVGCETIEKTYGVPADELRVFVHYQPQFYHFHVHFTRLHNDLGCQVERAHLIQDVIANLEADAGAYAKRTMYYQLKANDKLLPKIREHQQRKPAARDASDVAGGATRRKKSPARR